MSENFRLYGADPHMFMQFNEDLLELPIVGSLYNEGSIINLKQEDVNHTNEIMIVRCELKRFIAFLKQLDKAAEEKS